ncbi:DUF3889 domain-containing protein [Bacillus sp. WMMC1349]|uniref:DUF3889 domain-containing protein n=1 Tax=Bacillus sp. WMMC1349 TaxID=2736254 RepID=UPI001551DD5D|nr:DUF3889 domain-containing protein [Bacillus sp. WMMC1349]NPC93292.1 DUF3889 domain-containing protein [Bacillus sp. WMMC1349]
MLKRLAICFLLVQISHVPLHIQVQAVNNASTLSKWEERAIEAAQKRYPKTEVRSIQKVWDRKRTDEAVKQYHLTLNKKNKNFGVFVTISYEPTTHNINKIVIVEEYK